MMSDPEEPVSALHEVAVEPAVKLEPNPAASPGSPTVCAVGRFDELVRTHFAFVWRSLRRLGLSESDAEDGAQRVFLNLSEKLGQVEEGRERAYLFSTVVRIAASMRRRVHRRLEQASDSIDMVSHTAHAPDELLDQRRARALLDTLLDELPLEQRTVIILAEIEQMSKAEIAELLELPEGTVASRLRLGRTQLERRIRTIRAQQLRGGST